MTDNIDTNAIRKLTNAADDGPWTAHSTGLVWAERLGDPVSASADRANSAFIAAARTFVPQLCDEIDRLRAELAQIADAVAPTVTITPTVDAVRFLHRLYTDWVATAHERLAKVDEQAAEIAGLTAANQRLLDRLHNATPDLVTAQQCADQAEDRATDLAKQVEELKKRICLVITCADGGEALEWDGGIVHFRNLDEAKDILDDENWRVIDGNPMCGDCLLKPHDFKPEQPNGLTCERCDLEADDHEPVAAKAEVA